MILADTSVWVDHLRSSHDAPGGFLNRGAVLSHPFTIAELALEQMRQREIVLDALPRATVVTAAEVMGFVGRHALFGRGIGYVDVHLLAAEAFLAPRCSGHATRNSMALPKSSPWRRGQPLITGLWRDAAALSVTANDRASDGLCPTRRRTEDHAVFECRDILAQVFPDSSSGNARMGTNVTARDP